MKPPVVLIIFNRPDLTARTLAAVSNYQPEKLFVIADGPRSHRPEDVEKCAATRAVMERVDWKCEVFTNYSEVNLGCGLRPATGLDWVFEHTEEAIILEDDCLPHSAFFRFCEELLARYRNDERVMMIGGVNFLNEWKTPHQSYYFSRFGSSWGWASWRRAWRLNDYEMKLWPRVLEEKLLEQMFPDPLHCRYWKDIFEKVYDGQIEGVWDYQWLLACWLNSGFRVFPEVNLISNVGFREDATHTFGDGPTANMPTADLSFPLKHPPFVFPSIEADHLIQENFCALDGYRREVPAPNLLVRLARKLRGGR